MKQEAPHVNIERSIIKQFRKEIWRPFVKGLQDYEMIKDGDKVAVCISGGKDSMLLAKCLQQLKRQSRTDFELEFIVMDPGYNPDNRKLIEDNAALMNIPVRIFDSDIFDIVVDVEQSPCYLCARMRRGYLYAHAREQGCNKIALGRIYWTGRITTVCISSSVPAGLRSGLQRNRLQGAWQGRRLISCTPPSARR